MKFALALNDEEVIVPIVQGTIFRIYDNNLSHYSDFENPANLVSSGKRGKTIGFALEHNVEIFVSPPENFCELSYDKAQEVGLKFVNIVNHLRFADFIDQWIKGEFDIVSQLPQKEIVPSI